MHKKTRWFIYFVILSMLVGSLGSALSAAPAALAQEPPKATIWQDKVDPWVLNTALTEGETEFIVFLAEQADLSAAYKLKTKLEKGTYVFETLTAMAENTQGPVLAHLKALGVEHRAYWITNMIWVRGDMSVVQAMALREDVGHVYANPTVHMEEPDKSSLAGAAAPESIEWNISHVNAPDLWAMGITGQGVVIGAHDTGYDWNHPALINMYRGWDGGSADHNYHWHDAVHSGGGSCGADSLEPCDDHGHGTHTMGTMVGDDGGSNQVGMAPGAKWIGCRNMNVGNGTPTTYGECYQWFIAPTDLNDQNPDPAMAPHVINNSWGCPVSEGCTDPDVLLTIVDNVRAAGILTAHSAGNSGSGCSTVNTPAGIYDSSYTVGNTTSSDTIAGNSSRGPVTLDGSGRMKPDISAPGSNIRSSVPGGGYQDGWSGTSMAAPHVAGLVGLLISANPTIAGHVDLLEDIINQSAVLVNVSPPQTCGGVPHTQIPNNTFGWGRIDALGAYNILLSTAALEVDKTASAAHIAPGDMLTYTLTVSYAVGMTDTHNVALTDVIPADTSFVTATMPHAFDGSMVQWDNALMGVGDDWVVTLVVSVNGGATGTISNDDYGALSDEAPFVAGDAVDTLVAIHGLEVGKTASAPYVGPGRLLTYTLSATNLNAYEMAHNLVMTDVLPAGTTFVTATMPHTFDGSMVQWAAPSLAPSGVWDVELVVQAPIAASDVITNASYGVRSDETAPVSGLPVETQVYSLTITKAAGAQEVAQGGLLTYTLTAENAHPFTAANNVVITDMLPAGTTFVSASAPYTFDGTTVQWDAPTLRMNETWAVELVVQVTMTATGTVDNVAYQVSSDNFDPFTGAPVSTLILTRGAALASTSPAGTAAPGDAVQYSHLLTNTGGITETFVFSYHSSMGWSAVPDAPITVGPGMTATVAITLSVPVTATGGMTDTLTLTATTQTEPALSIVVTDVTKVAYLSFIPLLVK